MRVLPKYPYAGRMCRLKSDDTIENVIRRVEIALELSVDLRPIGETSWLSAWLSDNPKLRGRWIDSAEKPGVHEYPLLIRPVKRGKKDGKPGYLEKIEQEEKRFLLLSLDSDTVDQVLEIGGVAGQIVAPRIDVDRLVRDLVLPPIDDSRKNGGAKAVQDGGNLETEKRLPSQGRPYLLGAVWAAIEGHGRSLRNVSFFGDDLAEAKLFRDVMEQFSATRVGLRDHKTDKEILSISSIGEISLQTYRGPGHLTVIDELTHFLRINGYIDWREI